MNKLNRSLFGLALFMCVPSGFAAATHEVIVENFDFRPSAITIHPGDAVEWVWLSGFHSSTAGVPFQTVSDTGLWDSGDSSTVGNSFTETFGSAGSFPYYCNIHFFTGAVTVQSANASSPATNEVIVENFDFRPSSITIQPGDTVNWDWLDGDHSSTAGVPFQTVSDTGLWNSGDSSTVNFNFSYTFANGGSYPYYCDVHFFTGSVNVQAPNLPPTVSITNPIGNFTFSSPADINVSASATDSDGSVASVQFFNNGSAIGTSFSAPYSASVSVSTPGDYTLSAVATDNVGATATNSVTVHVVASVPIALDTPVRTDAANFQFNYSTAAGLTYIVQRADDLVSSNWTSISTNMAGSASASFQDTNAAEGSAYYRVLQAPNP